MVESRQLYWESVDGGGAGIFETLPPTALANHLGRNAPVILQRTFANGDIERYRGMLVGNVQDQLLLVEILESGDFLHGDLLEVRLSLGAHVLAFETRLVRLLDAPPLCFLKFPDSLRVVNLRRFQRLTVFLPVETELTGGTVTGTRVLKGRLTNLSAWGCALRTRAEIPGESQLKISFILPGEVTVNALRAKVIGCGMAGSAFHTRLKFLPDPMAVPTLKAVAKWVEVGLSYAG